MHLHECTGKFLISLLRESVTGTWDCPWEWDNHRLWRSNITRFFEMFILKVCCWVGCFLLNRQTLSMKQYTLDILKAGGTTHGIQDVCRWICSLGTGRKCTQYAGCFTPEWQVLINLLQKNTRYIAQSRNWYRQCTGT